MSRNCLEKLGDTRAFCYSFAIELLLRGQFSTSVQGWNCCVQKICCTPVTGRSVAKVLSLTVLPTSELKKKTSSRFNFSKIPPFYYSVAMVSLREPVKVQDRHRRFSRGVTTLTNAVWAVRCVKLSLPGNLKGPPNFFSDIPAKNFAKFAKFCKVVIARLPLFILFM